MSALKLSTVLTLLIFTEAGRADPLDTWTWRYPLPPRLPLSGVTYGNGQFVAVVSSPGRIQAVPAISGAANL